MSTIAERIGALFVVGLGDNFYNTGVTVEDAITRFTHTFDEVKATGKKLYLYHVY